MTTILVADDSEPMRRMIRRMLEAKGYAVIEAADGNEGIRRLSESKVDVIVTDIFMPESDGIDFVRRTKEIAPGVPIIAMSGGARELPTAVALALSQAFGALRILYKPFPAEDLLRCIAEMLNPAKVEE